MSNDSTLYTVGDVARRFAVTVRTLRHWEALGRPFLAFGAAPALRSWSGSMFEYLMPLLVMKLIFGQMGKAPVPWLLRPVGAAFGKGVQKAFLDKQLKPHMQMIEQHLAANPWFAGQRFSIADIQMSFPLLALARRAGLEQMPASQKWLQTVQQRAAWQRAIDQGGELSLPG